MIIYLEIVLPVGTVFEWLQRYTVGNSSHAPGWAALRFLGWFESQRLAIKRLA